MHADTIKGLFSLQDVLTKPLPPVEWDVESLIPQGNRVVIYGEFGCGKSWLLLDLALHLSLGRPWLGHFEIDRPHMVLYIDEEMTKRTLQGRLLQLHEGLTGGTDVSEARLSFLSHTGVKFAAAYTVQALLEELQSEGVQPDVVIVDTLRRVLGGSENEQQHVSDFWSAVEPFVRQEITFIVSHHMKKPGPHGLGDTRNRFSGSTDILAGADAGFAVMRDAQNGMTVECVKLRDAEEPPPFRVVVADIPGSQRKAVELEYLGTAPDTTNAPKLLEAAVKTIEAHTQPGTIYKAQALHGILKEFTPSTAQRAVVTAVAQKVLERTKRGVYQRLDRARGDASEQSAA